MHCFAATVFALCMQQWSALRFNSYIPPPPFSRKMYRTHTCVCNMYVHWVRLKCISDSIYFCSAALVGNCRIEKNSPNAVGLPMEAGLDAPLYSCTPAGSGGANCGREVHVIANYDCGPSSVVSVSVTMDSTRHSSNNSKPLVFILMNSRPIHWLLEIPDNVTVQRVILVSSCNLSWKRYKHANN